ncbi:MAG: hypothetical protein HF978_00425 [Desulfobacteraceae bacterium]|nr:hypothetical protein [Desulfobacteraceae bacterium]MBC2753999.1 hypothetical protein [Desulfobacteraceae bacterium]
MIKDYLQFHLKVPESLKDFTINKSPEIVILDTYYPWIPLNEGQEVWQCFVVYDAKNEQGVYVGRKLHVVWFRHNRIIAFDYKELELEYQIEERIKNPGY